MITLIETGMVKINKNTNSNNVINFIMYLCTKLVIYGDVQLQL